MSTSSALRLNGVEGDALEFVLGSHVLQGLHLGDLELLLRWLGLHVGHPLDGFLGFC